MSTWILGMSYVICGTDLLEIHNLTPCRYLELSHPQFLSMIHVGGCWWEFKCKTFGWDKIASPWLETHIPQSLITWLSFLYCIYALEISIPYFEFQYLPLMRGHQKLRSVHWHKPNIQIAAEDPNTLLSHSASPPLWFTSPQSNEGDTWKRS